MSSEAPDMIRAARTPSAGTNMLSGANPISKLLCPPENPITRDSRMDPPNATPRNTRSGEGLSHAPRRRHDVRYRSIAAAINAVMSNVRGSGIELEGTVRKSVSIARLFVLTSDSVRTIFVIFDVSLNLRERAPNRLPLRCSSR